MNCDQARDALLSIRPGGSPGGETRAHLESCPACRREWQETLRLFARIEALPREAPPHRDLWPGVAARLGSRWNRPLWAAAAALFLILLGWLAVHGDREQAAFLGPALRIEQREWEAARNAVRELLASEPIAMEAAGPALEILAEARLEVLEALASVPGDPGLTGLLLFLHERQLALSAVWP